MVAASGAASPGSVSVARLLAATSSEGSSEVAHAHAHEASLVAARRLATTCTSRSRALSEYHLL